MDIKELRERLKKISHNIYASDNDFADAVLSLIDLELRKAEKWRKVEEMAGYKGDCGKCPNDSLCMEFPTAACYICKNVVNALKEST